MAAPTLVQTDSKSQGSAGTTITVGPYTQPVDGNLMLAWHGIDEGAGTPGFSDPTPGPWSQLDTLVASGVMHSRSWDRVAEAAEPTSIDLATTRQDSRIAMFAEIAGFNPANPIEAKVVESGSGDTVTPSPYTADGDALVLYQVFVDRRPISTVTAPGWNLEQDRDQGAVHGQLWSRTVTGGETASPPTLTLSAVSNLWHVYTYVFGPPGGGVSSIGRIEVTGSVSVTKSVGVAVNDNVAARGAAGTRKSAAITAVGEAAVAAGPVDASKAVAVAGASLAAAALSALLTKGAAVQADGRVRVTLRAVTTSSEQRASQSIGVLQVDGSVAVTAVRLPSVAGRAVVSVSGAARKGARVAVAAVANDDGAIVVSSVRAAGGQAAIASTGGLAVSTGRFGVMVGAERVTLAAAIFAGQPVALLDISELDGLYDPVVDLDGLDDTLADLDGLVDVA